MDDMDKIKDKIRKLRSRAHDAASSEEEVMAAITIAERLMRENSITISDLKTAATSGDIGKAYWTRSTRKLHPVQLLANAISVLTDTRGWVQTTEVETLVYFGFAVDTEYAMYLTDLAHNAMEAEWEKFRNTPTYESRNASQRAKMRRDFMLGMGVRIREKIMDLVATRIAEGTTSPKTGTELVVAKRAMIADEMDAIGVDPRPRRKGRKQKSISVDAYLSGQMAGERTTITTGIGQGNE